MLFLAYASDAGITTIVKSASVEGDGGVVIVVGTVGTVNAAGGGGGGKTIMDSRMTMLPPPLSSALIDGGLDDARASF